MRTWSHSNPFSWHPCTEPRGWQFLGQPITARIVCCLRTRHPVTEWDHINMKLNMNWRKPTDMANAPCRTGPGLIWRFTHTHTQTHIHTYVYYRCTYCNWRISRVFQGDAKDRCLKWIMRNDSKQLIPCSLFCFCLIHLTLTHQQMKSFTKLSVWYSSACPDWLVICDCMTLYQSRCPIRIQQWKDFAYRS
jgi:hypothetical protein